MVFSPNPKGSPAGETMKQEYFVVVLAHSLRGRLRRVQIPHTAVYAVLGLAVLGGFSAFGFVASYARMVWKVANYNALKQEADSMRARYQNLQKVVSETNVQMASLQLYAREVSVAYGIKQKLEGPSDISSEGKMVPSFTESLQEYNYLINADKLAIANRRSRRFGAPHAPPSLWPVEGRLMDGFARRMDPFSGEGSFHKGIDITAPTGTAVRTTAVPVGAVISMPLWKEPSPENGSMRRAKPSISRPSTGQRLGGACGAPKRRERRLAMASLSALIR